MKVILEIKFDVDVDESHRDIIGKAIFAEIAASMPGVIIHKEFDAILENFELIRSEVL